ncbi:MAG TPA: GMC family oxidoreductase [Thermoanaerobaculia bacterium]|nr:GMC family oxidoreductase [Thermoanaerobaculia bacterium]
MSANQPQYDFVIIGAGVSGNLIAWQLGLAGKKVLILEAGPAVPDNRGQYMENFYTSLAKTPESPYPPLPGNGSTRPLFPLPDPGEEAAPRFTVLQIGKGPDQSYMIQESVPAKAPDGNGLRGLPFSSTFERIGGGTAWHWLGTSLRLVPHDLTMQTTYGVAQDWPVPYDELELLYGKAEAAIGVAASVAEQAPLQQAIGLRYPPGYEYPMPPIPMSIVDETVSKGIAGLTVSVDAPQDPTAYPVFVSPTPAGRNSIPNYQERRQCAGNTNCIPICPIQAKWDPTVTLNQALDTGNVTVQYQTVAVNVAVDANGNVTGIDYLQWSRDAQTGVLSSTPGSVSANGFALCAHAIENVKLLLMSNGRQGVANSSDQVGRNLMDHVLYLSWAMAEQPVWGYRGPLATSGIESLRDGAFRKFRSAFRLEIGNEGWNFPKGDPYTTLNDFISGTNDSALNPDGQRLGGLALATKLNELYTHQFRIAALLDQMPQPDNRVTLHPYYIDGLGLPRPHVEYGLDDYTLDGFLAAKEVCTAIYEKMGAKEYTEYPNAAAGDFFYKGVKYHLYGAGHIMGTHRMGIDPKTSVVNGAQRSHDCANLWITGSGSFPTVGTANPTLTIVALAFKTAQDILSTLT